MEDIFSGIGLAFSPYAIIAVICGVVGGIVVGALPGLSATMAVAILTPLSFGMTPAVSMAMLLGTYVGAVYGGSISAILIRTPGTPAACATIFDGYPMTQRGEAGKALGWAALGSCVGGMIGLFFLVVSAPLITRFALSFSAPEYFGLAIFGLSIIISVSGKHVTRGMISGAAGLLVATIGMDPIQGSTRFIFNSMDLLGGISLISALIGLFAVSEAFNSAETVMRESERIKQIINGLFPLWREIKGHAVLILKSAVIGTFIGALPGAGADIAAFVSYNEARRSSRTPEKFGTGFVDGVIAAETGNNAVTGGAMIPLLTLAIPGDAVTAVLLGALMIHGLKPGPMLMAENRDLVYSFFCSLFVGNLLLLVFGIGGIKVFTKVVALTKRLLVPIILILCVIGAYAVGNNLFDAKLALAFGVLGYLMQKADFPVAPLALAIILGPMAEVALRQSLIMNHGSWSILATRPISLGLLIIAALSIFFSIRQAQKENKKREAMRS
ncbi:MAG: tripartite tricarboxylate transporter permease [Planctomycetota bacterium]|jgi:putative tricarboxylic transport membrane protein|nr:tripartite tricarboxylate transporter permease [Planctomycetota bacterium]